MLLRLRCYSMVCTAVLGVDLAETRPVIGKTILINKGVVNIFIFNDIRVNLIGC